MLVPIPAPALSPTPAAATILAVLIRASVPKAARATLPLPKPVPGAVPGRLPVRARSSITTSTGNGIGARMTLALILLVSLWVLAVARAL